MKKIYFIIGCFLLGGALSAQEPADALRFSWTVPSGTARQQAIGGAMGSLGGDISTIFSNPAGLAFYRTGDITLSPSYRFGNIKSTYFGRTEKQKGDNTFRLGTSGFVLGSGNNANRKISNIAIGIVYNRAADFNSRILYRGVNNQSSYSDKFLEEIRNSGYKDSRVASEFPFGTSLAVNTYWVDTVAGGTSGNYSFQSRSRNLLATGLLQQQNTVTQGGINEFSLGIGASVHNKLMFGGSLSFPVLNFERDATFVEADATENVGNKFNAATFSENLGTKGVGLNVKAGLIYKPVDFVRLGLAIHTPTIYNLTDTYSTSLTTDTEGYQGVQTQTSDFLAGSPSEFKYTLITPYRIIASAAYVLREIEDVRKQKGFLTADIEYVNYKASSFHPYSNNEGNDQSNTDYLKSLNKAIDNAYKGAFNVRAGGELKFTTIMVRAGVAYYGNPYKDIQGEKGNKLNLSGGLGYRNKGMFLDLTYVYAMGKDVNFPYRLDSRAYPKADLKTTGGSVLATIGLKF